jgi:DNA-directed RNA polymerase subunit M/transcription elongation factor TFIIS
MEVNFCKCCDNLLYIYSNEENTSLYLGCKVCGNKEDHTDSKCIYSNEFSIDLSETINKNENLIYDITLPSIKNNPNIKCPNKECESIKENKPSDILYIKYNHDKLQYLYVCKYCNQKWKNK